MLHLGLSDKNCMFGCEFVSQKKLNKQINKYTSLNDHVQ